MSVPEKVIVSVQYVYEDGRVDPPYKKEFPLKDFNMSEERHLSPRYENDNLEPVGFWDTGVSLSIKASNFKNPEPV